ncbi:MAG TPA: thioesterase family protein [Gemmatimonadaceae bacterium]|nr:thioesterase family protein [Gemmatimonadaceae bacterium]
MLRFPLATRYSDYDTKGHVNNAVYLTYFEWSRVQAWQQVAAAAGIAAADIADPPLIVAEARVKYVSPANIGVPLAIEIGVKEVRTKGFSFSYRVVAPEENDRLVAEGETVQVAYDYRAGRTMPISPEMRKALEGM